MNSNNKNQKFATNFFKVNNFIKIILSIFFIKKNKKLLQILSTCVINIIMVQNFIYSRELFESRKQKYFFLSFIYFFFVYNCMKHQSSMLLPEVWNSARFQNQISQHKLNSQRTQTDCSQLISPSSHSQPKCQQSSSRQSIKSIQQELLDKLKTLAVQKQRQSSQAESSKLLTPNDQLHLKIQLYDLQEKHHYKVEECEKLKAMNEKMKKKVF